MKASSFIEHNYCNEFDELYKCPIYEPLLLLVIKKDIELN